MSDEVVYSWRDAVTDDEVAELIDSHGGRSEARWWDQIRPHSLGWVTARTAVLDPTVDLLADLARGGPALAFAVGTGRVALPLHERGLEVHRIELSPPMVDQLRQKPGAKNSPVTIGDMTCAMASGRFRVVYLMWDAIMNVTTQEEQTAVSHNAFAHLEPGVAPSSK